MRTLTILFLLAQTALGAVLNYNQPSLTLSPSNVLRSNLMAGAGIAIDFTNGGRAVVHSLITNGPIPGSVTNAEQLGFPPNAGFNALSLAGLTKRVWYPSGRSTLTNVADVSAVCFYPSNHSLFTVHNNNAGRITEWSLDGRCLRVINSTGNGLPDVEGICWLRGDWFAVCEEDYARVFVFRITNGMTTYATNQCIIVAPPLGTDPGLEGVSYDARRDCFWVVKEKTPASIHRVSWSGATSEWFTVSQMQAITNANNIDISDVFYDSTRDALWLAQDENGQFDRVLCVSLQTSNVIMSISATNFGQLEGVCLSPDGRTLWTWGEVNQVVTWAGFDQGTCFGVERDGNTNRVAHWFADYPRLTNATLHALTNVGVGTVTITTGSGAPSSSEPNGSVYLDTGGALYVRTNGAWLMK